MNRFLALIATIASVGCQDSTYDTPATAPESDQAPQPVIEQAESDPAGRRALFGDLHLHTRWSFDAYSLGVPVSPEDAYAYARGEAIDHVSGEPIQRQGPPLDFMALTEHSEYMGVSAAVDETDHPWRRIPLVQQLVSDDPEVSGMAARAFAASLASGEGLPDLLTDEVIVPTWSRIVDFANAHNRPGEFTAMVGYEYSPMPDGQNLHRNIIFRDDQVPSRPFSGLDSSNPEDLWDWMDARRAEGIVLMAIPHNGNTSNGLMWAQTNTAGRPLDRDYLARRNRNELVAEVLQIKGQSETHPTLSPEDEWAGFEQFDRILGRMEVPSQPSGSFVRDALKNGLSHAASSGINPFQLGMIGSSDGHNAASAIDEANYIGKIGFADGTPEVRLDPTRQILADRAVSRWGAAGLAGVWAAANTRASIYDALARRETFATSGPRIQVRFFAGWDFGPDDLDDRLTRVGYARGVPMGGTLEPASGAAGHPTLLIDAIMDPNEAALERAQVVKGWVEQGEVRERVYDVACRDATPIDPDTDRCGIPLPDLDSLPCDGGPGGAGQLRAHWQDPDFDPDQHAFYYVRVLQVPTCRWSTYDAERLGIERPAWLPRMIQERAISSAVWYTPDHDQG